MIEKRLSKELAEEAAVCIGVAAAIALPLAILSHRAAERFTQKLLQSSPPDRERRTSPHSSSTQ